MSLNYLKIDSQKETFTQTPDFIYKAGLKPTTVIIYGLLYTRAQLSIKNGWNDEHGRVYVIYPLKELSNDSGVSIATVTNGLKELEEKEFVERVRTGRNSANKIYIGLPKEGLLKFSNPDCQNLATGLLKISNPDCQNLAPNRIQNKRDNNIYTRANKNKFHNFDQREYTSADYAEFETRLINTK